MAGDARNLQFIARDMFDEALRASDAGQAVRRAVKIEDGRLTIVDRGFDLRQLECVFAVALGKSARPMAVALDEILGARLAWGVVSASSKDEKLSARWQQFAGGHPLPNADSLRAGEAAMALVMRAARLSANGKQALVVFLVSGGGSAMMEALRAADDVSLADLRAANELLVHCGATIAEINAVRRAWSFIKGGGLSRVAKRSLQISLIVSDTNKGDEISVASGPTFAQISSLDVQDIVEHYNLAARFPPSLLSVLMKASGKQSFAQADAATHSHYTLLDNEGALKIAASVAKERGFVVQTAHELVEAPIAAGCAESVARLLSLHQSYATNEEKRGVCLISGGEFVCPVRGRGTGGRNTEAALRTALDFEREIQLKQSDDWPRRFVALYAGTDGLDGNSPAAGAICDDTTLARARALNLNALDYLARSDSYTFFARLGDTLMTGATETNVRDVRIMLAC